MSDVMLVLAIIGCFVISAFAIFGVSCLVGYLISGGEEYHWTVCGWIASCFVFAVCMTIYVITTNVKGV